MSDQVTLTATTEEIRKLIKGEQQDAAIALCQHVLRYFPKHIETYRLMAEAALEKGDVGGAQELFGRVLSADPENFVAYAGLAIIFEQQHLADEAYWHLERAHELAPANFEVRKELTRLATQVEGKPRTRLKITPGGLARVYEAEGLFAQAAQEFRTIAGNQPKRFDARVALTEVLWRSGQVSQAADTAQALLRVLPFCLKANLILGTALQQSGVEEADTHLQLAEALDPTNRVARDLLGTQSPLHPNDPVLPRYVEEEHPLVTPGLIFDPEAGGEKLFATGTEAESSFGSDWEGETTPTEPAAEAPTTELNAQTPLPDWLVPAPAAESPPLEDSLTAEEWSPVQKANAEVPAAEAVSAKVEPPVQVAEDSKSLEPAPEQPEPDSKSESAHEPAAPSRDEPPSSDLPAWVRADFGSRAGSPPSAPHPPPKPSAAVPSSLPPWLTGLPRTSPNKSTKAEKQSPPESSEPHPPVFPAWLKQEPGGASPSAATADQSAAAEAGDGSDLARSKAQEPLSEMPSWLVETPPQAQPAATGQEPGAPAAAPATPEPMPAENAAPAPPDVRGPEKMPPPSLRRRQVVQANARLEMARAYTTANQFGDALDEYEQIVAQTPLLISEVIPDLEKLVAMPGVPLKAHRVLGDAYTRVDRLGDALEQYRFVLDRVA